MTMPSFQCDILGLGCVAIDDLLTVASFPKPDTKQQVLRRERQCGGLTGTALVAAARMGARCAYASTMGTDPLAQFVVDAFTRENIDLTLLRRQEGIRPIHSTIIVDASTKTRTILYDLEGVQGAQVDWPPPEAIRSTRVLYVDHYGIEGMIRATGIAQSAGIPVVADFERDDWPGFRTLLELVDHVIVSLPFAQRLTKASTPAEAVESLCAERAGKTVVVTCGEAGCWYASGPPFERARTAAAFPVEVVDTTGCGDVFHGAYAAALVEGRDLPTRIRFASAAAALKATQRGGQAGIPTRAAVQRFLAANHSSHESA